MIYSEMIKEKENDTKNDRAVPIQSNIRRMGRIGISSMAVHKFVNRLKSSHEEFSNR